MSMRNAGDLVLWGRQTAMSQPRLFQRLFGTPPSHLVAYLGLCELQDPH